MFATPSTMIRLARCEPQLVPCIVRAPRWADSARHWSFALCFVVSHDPPDHRETASAGFVATNDRSAVVDRPRDCLPAPCIPIPDGHLGIVEHSSVPWLELDSDTTAGSLYRRRCFVTNQTRSNDSFVFGTFWLGSWHSFEIVEVRDASTNANGHLPHVGKQVHKSLGRVQKS